MTRYYDRAGNPMERPDAWAKKFEDATYMRVAETTLPDGRWVSTVWLGLDHSFEQGPPLIFETMVFAGRGDLSELYCKMYSTEQEAKAGHEAVVKALLDGVDPDDLAL